MFIEKLYKPLAQAFLATGYTQPTAFQEACIPKINAGNDIFGVAAEGSGKTTCIVLATINKLKQAFEDAPRALIIVSTKDEVLAIAEQFSVLAEYTDLRWAIAHERGDIDLQKEEIYVGTDIVIGTPKRLQEIYFKNSLNLNKIKLFIIDDAEKMVAQGMQGPIDRMGESITKCQHLVFTNNLNERVERLTEKFMEKAIVVEIE